MLVNTIARYRPKRTAILSLDPVLNEVLFGAPSIGPPVVVVDIFPTAIGSSVQFGAPVVLLVPPGPDILTPTAVNNANAFGSPTAQKVVATSYANPNGTGDRTGTIVASSSPGLFSSGNVNKLINGVTGSVFDCDWNGFLTNAWLKFDFGTARVIDAFRWYQGNNANHGTWKWQGSVDDSAYVDVGSSFTLDGPIGGGGKEITEPAANSTAYRYWKMTQVSGATSNSPFIYEIEFKIA